MKVDFHIHSSCSDGELEPREILRSAVEAGCEMFSITDHDSIAAYGMLEDSLKVRYQESFLVASSVSPGRDMKCT